MNILQASFGILPTPTVWQLSRCYGKIVSSPEKDGANLVTRSLSRSVQSSHVKIRRTSTQARGQYENRLVFILACRSTIFASLIASPVDTNSASIFCKESFSIELYRVHFLLISITCQVDHRLSKWWKTEPKWPENQLAYLRPINELWHQLITLVEVECEATRLAKRDEIEDDKYYEHDLQIEVVCLICQV